jgi:hypothetical protein
VGCDLSGQIEPLFKSIIFHYRALLAVGRRRCVDYVIEI